jgi:hypothetical protein
MELQKQSVTIITTEKYSGDNLRIISSMNYIDLPPGGEKKFGTDSVVIKARRVNEYLEISSNTKLMPLSNIPYTENLMTTAGALFVTRNMDFKIGNTIKHKFVNLLKATGTIPDVPEVIDSVINIEKITVPAGTFNCYKVMNMVSGIMSFTYYTTDKKHIPVKTELIDPESGKFTMTLVLQKYE